MYTFRYKHHEAHAAVKEIITLGLQMNRLPKINLLNTILDLSEKKYHFFQQINYQNRTD